MGGDGDGIGAGLAFGHREAEAGVELRPVGEDVAVGIVERHGLGREDELAFVINVGFLHQLGAIDVVVGRAIGT